MDRQMDGGLTEKETLPECVVLVAQCPTPVLCSSPGLDRESLFGDSSGRAQYPVHMAVGWAPAGGGCLQCGALEGHTG